MGKRLVLVLLGMYIGVMGYVLNAQAVSMRFVDEEDNIALGMYLLQGEKLYGDLFSHHQPMAYILSAGVQGISQPNSLYLLIKYHRLAVYGFSLIWIGLLVRRFGGKTWGLVLVYEPIKFLLLGQMFLSESLAIYPLVYLLGSVLEEGKEKRFDGLLVGVSAGLVMMLLAPAWPVTGWLVAVWWIKKQERKKRLIWFLAGWLPIILASSAFVSVKDYWFYAFEINFGYYIPQSSDAPGLINIWRAMITPLAAIFTNDTSRTIAVIRWLAIGLLTIVLLKWRQRRWWEIAVGVVVLGLANIRYIAPSSEIYSGFHLLPWMALLCVYVGWQGMKIWQSGSEVSFKVILWVSLGIAVMLANVELVRNFQLPKTREERMFVLYGEDFGLGKAIEVMAHGNTSETLFTAPEGWLLYWLAGVDHASKMLNYYGWMSKTAPLSEEVAKSFERDVPPTYVYYREDADLRIEQWLDKYVELAKDRRKSNLYVLEEKAERMSQEQIHSLRYYGFELDSNN